MSIKQHDLFRLGSRVAEHLPREVSIFRPSKDGIRIASLRLQISQSLARKALSFYAYN
jgi:hypothetical protein